MELSLFNFKDTGLKSEVLRLSSLKNLIHPDVITSLNIYLTNIASNNVVLDYEFCQLKPNCLRLIKLEDTNDGGNMNLIVQFSQKWIFKAFQF